MNNNLANRLFYKGVYGVAIREKGSEVFSTQYPTNRYAYADPFVYEYEGKPCLFVELFDYHRVWGSIAVSEIKDGKLGNFRMIIAEPNHMSFPNVFEYKGALYMLPETYQTNEVHLYQCVEYPYKWEKRSNVVCNAKLVDHAILMRNDTSYYMVSYDLEQKRNRYFILDMEKYDATEITLSGNHCMERPGGTFFMRNGKYYHVIQDCKECYGDYLHFYEVDQFDDNCFNEHEVSVTKINDVHFDKDKGLQHIHTYSQSEHYEAVDFQYNRFYWNKFVHLFVSKLIFRNRHPY